jgi:hypothetical protein
MGLPEINISFSSLAVSAIQRSQRGIVALILKDDTGNFDTKEYRLLSEVDSDDWTATNYDYIRLAFMGTPSKVIVERLDTEESDYDAALARLGSKRWHYLAIPGIQSGEVADVVSQVKSWRAAGKTFKAVLPNASTADHEAIINFATDNIVAGETTYSTAQYTARIAGILAGLPLTRSSTYYVLPEVESITESTDPDADIDAGKLILINDDGVIKIARGVNSLTTVSTSKSPDWKKIKIIEGMDLIRDDITRTFADEYIGKVLNSYDNQVLLISAISAYLRGLEGDVLDPNGENSVTVDVEAQRQAWESIGTDTSGWNDETVKKNSFGSKVFLAGRIKLLDAVEDLDFKITV